MAISKSIFRSFILALIQWCQSFNPTSANKNSRIKTPHKQKPQFSPVNKLKSPNMNPRNRTPAQIGLKIRLLCSQIISESNQLLTYEVIRRNLIPKPRTVEYWLSLRWRFGGCKASNKPSWNDGIPNSAKKRRQHRRRGLFLEEPRSIWGLGFTLLQNYMGQILRGWRGGTTKGEFHRNDKKKELAKSLSWSRQLSVPTRNNANTQGWNSEKQKMNKGQGDEAKKPQSLEKLANCIQVFVVGSLSTSGLAASSPHESLVLDASNLIESPALTSLIVSFVYQRAEERPLTQTPKLS